MYNLICIESTIDEKENDVTLENTGHMKAFMEHVKESSVNSPKSLQRIQTVSFFRFNML